MSFKFLKESPQSDHLEFGHGEIVSTLEKIVCNEDNNLTIGLFGSWGTGKSSIVESLKKKLKIAKVPLVVFDVWKHEGDALRRTFLIELASQLENDFGREYFKEGYTIDNRLQFGQNSSKENFSIKFEKLKIHFPLLISLGAVFIVMVLIALGFLNLLGVDLFGQIRAKELILTATGTLSIGLVYKYVDYFIKAEKIDVKEERFQDPHEFSKEFSSIVRNLREVTNRIVITFDNLDRVSGDNALKIISTIKTFLDFKTGADSKTVFFLIPCDVNSMKDHISLTSKDDDKKELYWDEFLRKFFNTSIWIPDFYPTELESFAITKLQETGIVAFDNDYLSLLIIRVFNKNPRQIIQFINILLSNYLLLKEFCESGAFHDDAFYRENIPQLAKFLLIKQRHAAALELYQVHGSFDLLDSEVLESIKDENFKSLLKQTDDIYISSLEPFLKYRLSKSEQQNEKVVRLVDTIMLGNENDIKNLAINLDADSDNSDLNKVLRAKLSTTKNFLFKISLFNYSLQLCKEDKLIPEKALYKDLILFLSNPADWRIVYQVSPQLFFDVVMSKAPNITTAERKAIVSLFINALPITDNALKVYGEDFLVKREETILHFIVNYDKELLPIQTEAVQNHLERAYLENYVFDLVITDEVQQRKFVTTRFIEIILNRMSKDASPEILFQLFRVLTELLPKRSFMQEINRKFNFVFNKIFGQHLIELNQEQVISFSKLLARHLNAYAEVQNIEDVDNELSNLLERSVSFILDRNLSELIYYTDLLVALSNLEQSKFSIHRKIKDILIEGDLNIIQKITDAYPEIINIKDESNLSGAFIEVMVKYADLDGYVGEMSLDLIAELTERLVEEGQLERARFLVIKYRDLWDKVTIEELLTNLVSILVAKNWGSKSTNLHQNYLELIVFTAEHDIALLQKTLFWDTIADLLIMEDPFGMQLQAYEVLGRYIDNLTPIIRSQIAEKLIYQINSHGRYNDYLLNEAIFLLLERKNAVDLTSRYVKIILDEIVYHSTNVKVFQVIRSAIEQLDYNIFDFFDDIKKLQIRFGDMQAIEQENIKIVLYGLIERIKISHEKSAKDIIKSITPLLKNK